MTIAQAIERIDSLKHNTYTTGDKIEWLSRLDAMIKRLVIDTHDGADEVIFDGYDDHTNRQTELLVPSPFDEIYLRWLEAQIDYHNGEYNKYNTVILMYQAAYDAFDAWYNRTHKPIGNGKRFVF